VTTLELEPRRQLDVGLGGGVTHMRRGVTLSQRCECFCVLYVRQCVHRLWVCVWWCVWREWSPGSCVRGPTPRSISVSSIAVEPLEARRARVVHTYIYALCLCVSHTLSDFSPAWAENFKETLCALCLSPCVCHTHTHLSLQTRLVEIRETGRVTRRTSHTMREH
jgi:hypothetical protein